MEFLQRDLNIIANDKERGKRKSALGRVASAISKENFDEQSITAICRTCVRSLEDPAESCRGAAVELLEKLLPKLGDDGPDWLFPVIATRMTAIGDAQEPSEQQRLDVFALAMNTMRKYRHEIGARGFVATIADIIGAAIKDKFPDLLKAACRACTQLCESEPKGVKHFALPLAKLVKLHGLQHKHSSVRVEAVNAFATLIAHGAVEILGDMKDEMDNRTSIFFISILAHDHTDSVRKATLKMLERLLTDITDRLEQHRRLVPIVLVLLTDTAQEIRDGALQLMEMLGKLYKIDHEDNRIDMENRRVTVKDMEWYGDDEVAFDMNSFAFKSQFDLPKLEDRPGLGSRLVVAEAVRHFLDKLLSDLTAVEWLIPFSNVSRRMSALRILHMCFWFCEQNITQHAEPILGALFKTLLHEDPPVRKESQFCVELLGKFLKPQFYLPILLRREAAPLTIDAALPSKKRAIAATTSATAAASGGGEDEAEEEQRLSRKRKEGGANEEGEEEDEKNTSKTTVIRRGTTTVTTTVMDADSDPNRAPVPTLFQCAAATTKRGILIALKCLLLGTSRTLEAPHAKQLVQAMCDPDILDLDSPPLVQALAEAIEGLIDVLIQREFIATPSKPLPLEVRERADQRTLDSMLLVVLLTALSCSERSVGVNVTSIIDRCSVKITGTATGWYDMHCLRILTRHAATLAPEAFAELIDKTSDLSRLGEVMTNLFVTRLSSVDYRLRVVNELRFLGELRKVLGANVLPSSSSSSSTSTSSPTTTTSSAAAAVTGTSKSSPSPLRALSLTVPSASSSSNSSSTSATAAAGGGGSQQQQQQKQKNSNSNNTTNEDSAEPSTVLRAVNFSGAQLELLIRSVILYHIRFVPGNTSHLFSKIAIQCLREVLRPERRLLLKSSFLQPWEDVKDPRESPTPLSEKIVSAWLSMIDNDDGEVRLTCSEMIYDICMMPLSAGLASECLVHMLNRLDDNLDPIRLIVVQQLHRVLTCNDDNLSDAFVNEVRQQLATMAKKFLLHLDDHRETIGIKPVLCNLLKRMCGMHCQLIHSMTREVRNKHSTPQYCDEILAFTPQE